MDLRKGTFFFPPDNVYADALEPIEGVTADPNWDGEPTHLGEHYIQMLAAFVCTQSGSESVLRSLQLDGFEVDKANLRLVSIEGPVSAQEEEDRLTMLARSSGLPQSQIILKHIRDASSLYVEGKDQPSLGQSRNILQALIDGIATETDARGNHPNGLPSKTAPRIEYLRNVAFLTLDEEAAFKSAWGSLSAGSHPGVPEREQVRIGLILALEFGQLLLMKFTNWKANAYSRFS